MMTAIAKFPTTSEPTRPQDAGLRAPYVSRTGWARTVDAPELPAPDRDLAFRQLRHHTKNALQRILCHVALQPGLAATASGRALARDLERRIHLVAAISDALFGFTQAPEALDLRLRSLGRSLVELLCDPGQLITLEVEVEDACPAALEETVVRVAHELVSNAVKHGMHVRLIGRIDLRVRTARGVTELTVSDDGWGYAAQPLPGEGLSVARLLAEAHGGTIEMRRGRDVTEVTLSLHHDACGR